jgi:hypothetical protein
VAELKEAYAASHIRIVEAAHEPEDEDVSIAIRRSFSVRRQHQQRMLLLRVSPWQKGGRKNSTRRQCLYFCTSNRRQLLRKTPASAAHALAACLPLAKREKGGRKHSIRRQCLYFCTSNRRQYLHFCARKASTLGIYLVKPRA